MKKRVTIALATLAVLSLFALGSVSTAVQGYEGSVLKALSLQGASSSDPATPIQHIIFIINENHAFDNMFGTYPGLPAAFALNLSECMPEKTTSTPCQEPYNADNIPSVQETDQCHTSECAVPAYDNGKMDGFYREDGNRTMAYYDGAGLPQVWDLASYFDLNYNFFSSAMSYSEPNHLYAVAANSPAQEDQQTIAPLNLTFPEIGTAMTNAGVTWGYFQYNWNDAKDCTGNYNAQSGLFTAGGGDGFWEGEAQFRQVQNTAIECSSLGNIKDFENALATNTLPQVSFVIPEPSESAHPGQGTWQANQQFITSVVNDIEQSSIWPHSVTYITWDDYGGYYDGVVPVQLDEFGDGFRVPLIAVSPYSISGALIGPCSSTVTTNCSPEYSYTNSYSDTSGMTTQDDFSAFLSTIEYNWGVSPIATRDAEEPNLFYMLNFTQSPLSPLYFNSNYALAAYPVTSCENLGGCQTGTPFAGGLLQLGPNSNFVSVSGGGSRIFSVYNASTPSWAESNAQAAAYAGNGDPDD
jgi:phospholipase C